MPFFARPNLDYEQFKQLSGTTLTLEGKTQISSPTGLTLTDGSGGYVPIILTGASSATNNYVLTYRDDIKGVVLRSGGTGGGGGIYPYNESATTTVGGLVAGTNLYNIQVVDILQEILVPTLGPTTIINPYSILSVTLNPIGYPTTNVYEIGSSISITAVTSYNSGTVSPVYCGGASVRGGAASCYLNNSIWTGPTTGASNTVNYNSVVINTTNTVSSCVCYLSGQTMLNSDGTTYLYPNNPLSTSATTAQSYQIAGVYPYYWGRVTCVAAAGVGRPSASCIKSIITGGTGICCKVSTYSNGTLSINFGSASSDYLWFAVPSGTTKTKWCVDALNNGNIGGVVSAGGNLFPMQDLVLGVQSKAPVIWSGIPYQVYVSNYQSAASIMYLKNS